MIYQFFKKRDSIKNESHKKQRGRSMVEMLGVLAIIGVLSIGGISGYTIAMRRYKANEIITVAGKYALTVYNQVQNLMLNDSENYYINKNNGRWMKKTSSNSNIIWNPDVVAFSNSGLGGMPNGLKAIWLDRIVTNNSGDIIVLVLDVDDYPLCQTIFNMGGNKKEGFIEECNVNYPPRSRLFFIMN